MQDLLTLNWIAILLAALAMFILGAIWYTVLFGKAWQNLLGFSDEYLQQGNMFAIFGSSFLYMIFMAVGLAFLMQHHPQAHDWWNGMKYGLWIGLFFVSAGLAINYIYQRHKTQLWFIDAAYTTLGLGLMGAILGAMH